MRPDPCALLAACALTVTLPVARAAGEPASSELSRAAQPGDRPPRTYLNLRIGGAVPFADERPEICLEAAPHRRFSFEMCGTGSGFLHHAPDPELMHARARLRLASIASRLGWFEPHLLAGFAELQVGDDDPGFDFTGPGRLGTETAGPEAGLALRWLTAIGDDWEAIAEASVSLAWLPHAPDLQRPESALQPTAQLSLGFGF